VALTPVNQDFNVNNGLVVLGTGAVTSSTAQSNALQVNGGAAIAKNLIVGTDAKIYGNLEVVNTLTVRGEIIANRLTIQLTTITTTVVTTDDIISTYNTTNATSTNSGALQIAGGAGIAKNLYVGGTIYGSINSTKNLEGGATNSIPYQSTSSSTVFLPIGSNGTVLSIVNGNLAWTLPGGAGSSSTVAKNLLGGSAGAIPYQSDVDLTTFDVNGFRYISSLTQLVANTLLISTSTSGASNGSGALQVVGGAYFGREVYIGATGLGALTVAGYAAIGKRLSILDYTNASSTGSGALILSNGGAYISQDIYVGGNIVTTLGGNQLVYTDTSGKLKNTVVSYNTQTQELLGTITNANSATYATNIYGGAYGSVLYQTATSRTEALTLGGEGTVLAVLNGILGWFNPYGFAVTTASNFVGGVAGAIPFQTGPGTTAFDANHLNFQLPFTPNAVLVVNKLSVSSTTNSISPTTGAFTVTGGVGISGEVYIANTSYIGGAQIVTTASIDVYTNQTLQTVTDRGNSTNNTIRITNSTISNSTNTGALQVLGGVGVGGSLYAVDIVSVGTIFAGNIYSNGQVVGSSSGTTSTFTINNLTAAISTNTGALVVTGGAGIGGSLYAGAIYSNGSLVGSTTGTNSTFTINNTTPAINTNTGALVVKGGAGIGGSLYAGSIYSNGSLVGSTTGTNSTFTINNFTAATNTNTGALVVKGGAGIGGSIYAGDIYSNNSKVITEISLPNLGVTAIVAGTDTAVSTATGSVTIWNTSTLESITGRGSNTTRQITITNNTDASSTQSGALQVTGGAGIGGDLYVGGKIVAQKLIIQLTTITTTNVVTDDVISTYNTTNATNTNSGALIVAGGVGIGGAVYIGTSSYIDNSLIITTATINKYANQTTIVAGTDTAINTSTGIITIWNTSTLQTITNRGNSTTNTVIITNASRSTSTTTGALVVTGGVGIGGSIYAGLIYSNGSLVGASTGTTSTFTINNLTASTSTTTGALVVTGGVGIGGSIYAGLIYSNGALVGASTGTTSTFTINNLTASTSTNSGALVVTGGVGIGGSIYAGLIYSNGALVGASTGTTSTFTINNLTASTSTTTGALVVTGGVGIGGAVYIGTSSYIDNSLIITTATINQYANQTTIVAGTDTAINTSTGIITIWNTSTLQTITNRGNTTTNAIYASSLYDSRNRVVTSVIATGSAYIGIVNLVSTGTQTSFGIINLGVHTLAAGTDTAVSSSTGTITIWNTSTLQTITNRGNTTTNAIYAGSLYDSGNRVVTRVTATGSTYIGIVNLVSTGTQTSFGIVNLGVQTITAGTDTAISTSTGQVIVWNTSTLQTITNRGNATTSAIYAGSLYDSGNRVVTSVIATGSAYIGIVNLVSTGTQTSFGIVNLGVQTLTAGTDTAISNSTGTITIWNTSTLQTITNRGNTTTNSIVITNLTESTGTDSGALIVAGGIGIGGTIYAGRIYSNNSLVGATTGTSSTFTISNLTESTSTNSGALVVTGGAGIGGSLHVAGNIYSSGQLVATITATNIFIPGNGISTGTNTGALIVGGGVGIGGDLNVAGDIYSHGLLVSSTGTTSTFTILNTTSSTSTTTGALVVQGGAGVAGDLYVGGVIKGTISGVATSATTIAIAKVASNTPRYLTMVSTVEGYAKAETSSTSLVYVPNRGLAIGTSTMTTAADPMSLTGNYRNGKVLDLYGGLYIRQVQSTISSGYYLGQGVYDNVTYINAGGLNNNFIWQINAAEKMYLSNAGYLGIGNRPSSDLHLHGTEFRHNDINGWNTYTFTLLNGVVQLASTSSLSINTSNVSITSPTNSTGTTTGALVVTGGVGIGGNLYVSGKIVAQELNIQLTTVTTTVVVTDDIISTYNTTNSTSTNSGALQVAGGAGIGGNIYVGGSGSFKNAVSINTTTASTSTITGALQVVGGIGVGGSVYVGNRVGFVGTTRASVVYQYYNSLTNSLDTIFG